MAKKVFLLIILFCISNFGFAQEKSPLKNAKVDPRMELLSIVFRLADAQEFKSEAFQSYVNDIDAHFSKHKNHELIHFIKEIRNEQGIGYDAVAKMAIHLSYPDLQPIIAFSEKIPEERWGTNLDNTAHFVTLLQKFHQESNFQDFYNQHQNLYKTAEDRFNQNILNEIDLEWYPAFYGKVPNEDFTIVLGMGFTGNFGVKLQVPNQKQVVYSILGTWDIDKQQNPIYTTENGYIETIIHEFNHSFVNYLQDNIQQDLKPYADQIYNLVQKDLITQAYGESITALNEGLVRAAVIEYLSSSKNANSKLKNEQIFFEVFDRKFYWVPDLVAALETYQNNRDIYPTLASYIPQIVQVYKAVAENPLKTFQQNTADVFTLPINTNSNSPKIVDFLPNNNAQNIPTDTKEIVLSFDKEMLYNFNIDHPPYPYSPLPLDSVKLSPDNRQMHLLLSRNLNENTAYGLVFKAYFKSVDSLYLDKNYLYTISTTSKPKINSTTTKNKKHFVFNFSTSENRILTDWNGMPKISLHNYLKNNKIESVKLVGDFNNWEQESDVYSLQKINESDYQISLSKKVFQDKPNFTYLINNEYLLVPNYMDQNVDHKPSLHYFKVEE